MQQKLKKYKNEKSTKVIKRVNVVETKKYKNEKSTKSTKTKRERKAPSQNIPTRGKVIKPSTIENE